MRCTAISAIAGGFIACSLALWSICCQRKQVNKQLQETKRQLDAEKRNRAAERTGRIRAEKKLRERESSREQCKDRTVPETYPLQPIGHLQSCFTKRSGTPRCLEGLAQYSHVWVIFIFHCNTDLQRLWSPDHGSDGLRAKVQVPRLNGERMGVLATRSPHRPSPIGLSVAEVIEVKGRNMVLGGADIVDGSPVLDIKPYLPFCDSLSHATAPAWVSDEACDDPITLKDVQIPDDVLACLEACWAAPGPGRAPRHALYKQPGDWVDLIHQVLRLDIRSLHQRTSRQGQQPSSSPAALSNRCESTEGKTEHQDASESSNGLGKDGQLESHTAVHAQAQQHAYTQEQSVLAPEQTKDLKCDSSEGNYSVILHGVTISYDVLTDCTVMVRGASGD